MRTLLRILSAAALLFAPIGARAGVFGPPGITVSGAVAVSDCVKFISASQIGDAGGPCGGSGSTGANPTASAGLTPINGVATTYMRSDAAPALDVTIAPNWTGAHQYSVAGAASRPGLFISGAHFSGGTGTTTFPQVLVQDSTATASTVWNTSGTGLGVNEHTGVGNLADFMLDGVSEFSVSSVGAVTAGAVNGITNTSRNAYTLTGTAAQTYTFPTTSATLARIDAANSFTGTQTFTGGFIVMGGQSVSLSIVKDAETGKAIQRLDTATTVSGTGLGTSPTVTAQNGTQAGEITAGTAPANATFTFTFGAATTGWACRVEDETSNASIVIGQTSHTTTTAVFQAYSRTTGATIALNASDVLTYICGGY